jgi:Family of unknown function (DUF6146)
MKYALIIFAIIFTFASCDSYQSVSGSEQKTTAANDTLHIKNDSLEYEIIIIEPGFNNWLVTQQPRGFYGQAFLEAKNRMFVSEYNQRVRNFNRWDPNLYQQEINYDFGVDYGYEVNYLLYNYFIYFQQRYNQRLPGSRG